jgi:hypothetical protein
MNKYNGSISKAKSGPDGVRRVRQKNPFDPLSRSGPTIDNVYSDAEPDAFDNQVTADGNKILLEPPQKQ